METIRLTYPHTLKQSEIPETIAAIGFFDGLHKGHQKVIKRAVDEANQQNRDSAVITFHPHPKVVLKEPENPVRYITPIPEKEKLIEKIGVDKLYIITFNKELSKLPPQDFIDHFIIGLHITHLVAGFDYTFGHKGKGNMRNIGNYTKGALSTTVIEPVKLKDEKVSSTRIRQFLAEGNLDQVNNLLGRPYETTGIVKEGDKRGRTLGFPTANIQIDEEKILPKQGVYAVKVIYKDKIYGGMANLGVIPTFHENDAIPSLEVYIFDFEGNIYGKTLTVLWYQFVREEKKFNGLDEIVNQLKKDEKDIRNYFK